LTSKIVGSAVNISTNASLNAWFKTTDAGASYDVIAGFWNGANVYFSIQISDGNILATLQDSTASATIQFSSPSKYKDGNWHMATIVKTGGKLELYIDGTFVDDDTQTFTGNFNSSPIYMGAWSAGNYYIGSVDEIGYWEKALSSTEVGQLYNGGNGLAYPLTVNNSNMFLVM
jgi:hypothetical protein